MCFIQNACISLRQIHLVLKYKFNKFTTMVTEIIPYDCPLCDLITKDKNISQLPLSNGTGSSYLL